MPKAPVSDIVTYYEEAGSGDALVLLTGLGADLTVVAGGGKLLSTVLESFTKGKKEDAA